MDISAISNNPSGSARSENLSVADIAATTRMTAAPVQTAIAVEQAQAAPKPAEVSQALKSINKALEDMSQSLEFALDEDSQRTIVKVVDRQTKEVIRQMPTEEALQISKALNQSQGLLIRQKV